MGKRSLNKEWWILTTGFVTRAALQKSQTFLLDGDGDLDNQLFRCKPHKELSKIPGEDSLRYQG